MLKPSIAFYTLGCRLNQSETATLEHSFELSGYNVVDFNSPADIVVINTCTVTENGDADTRRLVHKVNRINPKTKIALVGCQAQIQKEKLTSLPNVRWVVGNAKKLELAKIIEELNAPETPVVITPVIPKESFTISFGGADKKHTRANLKIQDGCDFFCSFCEIPYARGRARSREFKDILAEAELLTAAGHQEIVLTGINIGTYDFEQKKILDVIEALEKIEGLKRIRISSIEPTTVPWGIFERMTAGSKLCRYLHIPLQSGHDEILEAMLRRYSVNEFKEFIEKVAAKVPLIGLGTDVIVGFPGETDARFETTYEILRDLPFTYFHVFSYSPRYLAKSQNLSGPVPEKIIHERSKILRDLSARKRVLFSQSLIGTTQPVLFEEKKEGHWIGVTDNFLRIKTKSDQHLKNLLLNVSLKKVEGPFILSDLIQN